MSNEAQVVSYFTIKNGNYKYQPGTTAFKVDVGVEAGPTPGKVTVPTTGVDIDLTEITAPGGLCRIQNLDTVTDSTNFLSVGIYDGALLYPLMELLQGESYSFRLSRYLGGELATGTGTVGSGNTLHLAAYNATISAVVEAFNK